MAELSSRSDPHTQATLPRRIQHLLVAAAGWTLFAYWWVEVFLETRGSEVVFTAAFLSLSLIVISLVTSLWVSHNVSIFRRSAPRSRVREHLVAATTDRLGRKLTVLGTRTTLQEAPVIRITLEGQRKVYRSADDAERALPRSTVIEREAA